MKPARSRNAVRSLDQEGLERLALAYVGRFATTGAKLRSYLLRKVREREWQGSGPDLDRIVARFVYLGYVDDAAFAAARASALQRRGFGVRRIAQALRGAGIAEEAAAAVTGELADGAAEAALRFAQRKRIGPFAAEPHDRSGREKALAAMLRAGHPIEIARRIVAAAPGQIPDAS